MSACSGKLSDKNTDTVQHASIEIEGLGIFKPQCIEPKYKPYCYSQLITFNRQEVELIIYPDDDGSLPSQEKKAELRSMFSQFDSKLRESLTELPSHLRPLCADYEIDITKVSDEQIVSNMQWQNIKLQNDGKIECYSSNDLVTYAHDIVIGFDQQMRIEYVHFDG